MKKNLIGILGGSGPVATAELFCQINSVAQEQYGAVQDTDYPEMLIYNLPLHGFDETGIADEALVKQQVLAGVEILKNAGCKSYCIPCNTLHVYDDVLRSMFDMKFIHMPESTVQKAVNMGVSDIGILSSSTTRESALYKNICSDAGMNVYEVSDIEQKEIDTLIESVMGGTNGTAETLQIIALAEKLIAQGAQAIILGCTELPLLVKNTSLSFPCLNSLAVLAESVVAESR